MSYMRVMLGVEDADVGPQGAKEAVAMAVEPLGAVRVLWVEVNEPEQLGLDGTALPRPAHPSGNQARSAPSGGQAQTGRRIGRPRPYAPEQIEACFNCAQYRKLPGWDDAKQGFYGRCAATGKPVYTLGGRCGAWRRT